MTRPLLSRLVTGLVVATLFATGCVQQRRFRFVPAKTSCFPESATSTPVDGPPDQKPSLNCRSTQYKMAFIEFDEQGKLFDPQQDAVARKLLDLEKARATDGKVITVVYVHGWKNNAAEALPGAKPKDVEKFQSALLELGYRAAQATAATGRKPVPIVGIYLAWRGKTLMGPNWFTFASLWSRRNSANRIGDGPDLGAVVERIINLTNAGNDNSRVLLIGHSFGARVLEHAIESRQIKLYEDARAGAVVRPRVDLVLYVNSANDSRLSMARVQGLRDSGLRVHHPDYRPEECSGAPDPSVDPETRAAHCRDYPLLVAITSKGDAATKQLLPIASTINSDRLIPELEKTLPPLPQTDTFVDPLPSAGKVKKTAAGHFEFLQSHVAREVRCPALRAAAPREQAKTAEATIDEAKEQARFERAIHPVCALGDKDCRFVFRTLGDTPTCYQVDQRQPVETRPPFNTTPFWIMSVEPTVIKDHGDIWNVSFVEMLGQLMAPRGFFEPMSPRIQLRVGAPPVRQQ